VPGAVLTVVLRVVVVVVLVQPGASSSAGTSLKFVARVVVIVSPGARTTAGDVTIVRLVVVVAKGVKVGTTTFVGATNVSCTRGGASGETYVCRTIHSSAKAGDKLETKPAITVRVKTLFMLSPRVNFSY